MYSQPPPYGLDPAYGHPMTTQPQPSWGPNNGAANPAPAPTTTSHHQAQNGNGNVSNGGGGSGTNTNNVTNNTNNNNSNSNSNSAVVVNANVNAIGGFGLPGANVLLLIPKDRLQSRDWNSGICSCLNDVVGCMLSAVCLPLALMRVANRLNECACVGCCVPGGLVTLRTKVRTMGGIKGSICTDCLHSHFCSCCVVCQLQREMDAMKI